MALNTKNGFRAAASLALELTFGHTNGGNGENKSKLPEMAFGVKSNEALNSVLSGENPRAKLAGFHKLSQRDRAAAAALFYTVLERAETIDFIISRFSEVPLKKIKRKVMRSLQIGTAQLVFMETQPYAAVNEAVNLLPNVPELRGFVNATLKRISDATSTFPVPIFKNFVKTTAEVGENFIEDLVTRCIDSTPQIKNADEFKKSVLYSAPVWLVNHFQHYLGNQRAENILKAFLNPHVTYIRINTNKFTPDIVENALMEEKITFEKVEFVPKLQSTYKLTSGFMPDKCVSLKRGMFFVQDLSSQILCSLISPSQNTTIIDFCAAPGGKSFHLSQITGGLRGEILAFDNDAKRLERMYDNKIRLSAGNVRVRQFDVMGGYDRSIPQAEYVLCDVPCSCLGTLRRHPERKYNFNPDDTPDFNETQFKILHAASRYVKPGGILVYSTCTLNETENEEVTDTFAKSHPDFGAKTVTLDFKCATRNGFTSDVFLSKRQINSEYMITPDLIDCDGFFFSFFQRHS